MRWFHALLVETDFPTTLTDASGNPLPPPRIRVPASGGRPFSVAYAHVVHCGRGSSALDALIGVRSDAFTAPNDWTALDLDAAKLVYKTIMGVEPLAGQVS